MTLGRAPRQPDLFGSTAGFCDGRVAPESIYGLLHRECHRLFPDEMFADLFTDVGRRSVPPMIVAVVMVLQRIEGCSDREASDRFCFDARWKYAAGGLDFDYPGFVHTVLVDMRARLAASQAPGRIFDAVLEVAKAAGLVGRKRVLDSTALYDAVATMDTVTLVRSAIRGLLKVAGGELESRLRAVLARDDDYAGAGKPVCDYDDAAARAGLVDALARDGMALLAVVDGRELSETLAQAAALLATVLGQDLDQDEAGVFRIARRVAKDRVISTVDPDTRHGHKTAARGFDGYKGHVGIDPDTEIITATTVTAGNAGDASVAEDLISDLLDTDTEHPDAQHGHGAEGDSGGEPAASVYGDNAYGTGELHARLERVGIESKCKTQQPVAAGGRFAKDRFDIDLRHDTVRCPAGRTAPIRRSKQHRRRQLLAVLHPLPAAPALHHRPRRTHHHRRDPRTATRRCPGPTTRPGLGHRLPGHPTQGRTQDRPPDAPPPRRTPRPGPRHHQDRRRLRPARRRDQPRTPGRPRRGQRPRIRMGHRDPMSRTER